MQAFIKITAKDNRVDGTRTFYAVRMELVDGGVRFWAGGHGYFFKAGDILKIEPSL